MSTAQKRKTRLRSLMPLENWFAVLLYDTEPWFSLERVVCLAVDKGGENELDVITPYIYCAGSLIENCYDLPQFHALIHADDITPDRKQEWTVEAKENKRHT